MSVKSCGIAITEVLPSSCGIAIADSKKSCACPPLTNTTVWKFEANYIKMAQEEKTLFVNVSSILIRHTFTATIFNQFIKKRLKSLHPVNLENIY
jgi:hypothetical protein